MCKHELTEFVAELTEFAAELSEAQWGLFSETGLSKQYSARFLLLLRLIETKYYKRSVLRICCHEEKDSQNPDDLLNLWLVDP